MAGSDELVHELQIRNLIARLAHATDFASDEELDSKYLGCFTEDGIWEAPAPAGGEGGVVRRGHAELRAASMDRRRTKVGGPGSHTMHVVTPGEIRIQGNEAFAVSNFVYYSLAEGAPKAITAGLYHDSFRYADGAWRVSRRSIKRP